MNVPAKLAAFAAALGLAFGAGAAIGTVVGPLDDDGSTEQRPPPPTAPSLAPNLGTGPAGAEHGDH